jgi:hypothetical protein
MDFNESNNEARKPYYISVQAGQILEDPEAAAYELEIMANPEDISRLQELFEELASMDEAQVAHFHYNPYESASNDQINSGTDGIIQRIYRQLYECGTDSTKKHIEEMQIL